MLGLDNFSIIVSVVIQRYKLYSYYYSTPLIFFVIYVPLR